VDVQVVHVAAFGIFAQIVLGVAGVLIAQADEAGIVLKAPGIILEGADVEATVGVGPVHALEERVIHRAAAVFGAEEYAQAVFGVAGAAAEPAAEAQAEVD